jgi:hypothetical protein
MATPGKIAVKKETNHIELIDTYSNMRPLKANGQELNQKNFPIL